MRSLTVSCRLPQGDFSLLCVLVALAALALGILVYVVDRPPASTYFLPAAWSLAERPSFFAHLGGTLPDFAHVFAFILLTAAVVPGHPRVVALCVFWFGIETLFEVGQHPSLAPAIVTALPAWLEQVPVLDRTASYFLRGTFDPWDLVAIFVGTVTAYFTLTLIAQRHAHHALET